MPNLPRPGTPDGYPNRDNPIGSPAIRDFSGSLDMRRATKGVFVTTSSFTKDALETASQLSRHVVLKSIILRNFDAK